MKTHIIPERQANVTRSAGFTLIETAVVLVVIGLILGMIFKSRELIDQGRVKNLAAQHAKIIGAIST